MKIIDDANFNSNYELCKYCGGKCCKRNACDCSPSDFGYDVANMRKAIESGNYTIDFSRLDANSFIMTETKTILDTERVKRKAFEFFYIRPRNVGRPIVDIIHSREDEGPCIFWDKDKGCPLKYEERPLGGRTMIPVPGIQCILQYNKILMVEEWKPYTDELVVLAKEFFDENWRVYKDFNFIIK